MLSMPRHGLLDQYDYIVFRTTYSISSCIAFHFIDKIRYQFQKVTDKCFRKCVTSPGTSLGSSDQVCVRFTKELDINDSDWWMPSAPVSYASLKSFHLCICHSEMRCDVHGPLHGLLQPRLQGLRRAAPEREQQHVNSLIREWSSIHSESMCSSDSTGVPV